MLDFTWKLFSQTGNIDTYLLFKELEREAQEQGNNETYYLAERDYHVL
ncbi:YqzL-like protein [Anoxybacillus pushchinoensis]|uniref:YqzL-like protein n=1 Tax=Anoxybacillus pushchinoensis TaxID=150248 RepID=A0A1I0TQP6_9BACL|nr:YqzL family protein [Anoxybacillus pushchinoensis]SFA54068.1 YqzL-like protein [Anoxybacillus pushchinoensis]